MKSITSLHQKKSRSGQGRRPASALDREAFDHRKGAGEHLFVSAIEISAGDGAKVGVVLVESTGHRVHLQVREESCSRRRERRGILAVEVGADYLSGDVVEGVAEVHPV